MSKTNTNEQILVVNSDESLDRIISIARDGYGVLSTIIKDSVSFRGKQYLLVEKSNEGDLLHYLSDCMQNLVASQPNNKINILGWPSRSILASDDKCWGLEKIEANRLPEVDDKDNAPIVAVIDTGVDYNHPEIKDSLWTNPKDGRTHGYNALNGSLDPMDDHNHGTHCSGTIAGKTVGVAPGVKVMGCKFLSREGGGSTMGAIKATIFAVENGANITSNSWGGGPSEEALQQVYKDSPEVLHICAAGNSGDNSDYRPHFPSGYDLPNIISVAASDINDELAYFSNYGRAVHLAAPGVDIRSSVIGGGYANYSGTSMATPHVSGVASYIFSQRPKSKVLMSRDVFRRILAEVDHVEAFKGKLLQPGRLNAFSSAKIEM